MNRFKCILAYASLDRRDHATLRHAAWMARVGQAEVTYLAHVVPSFDLPANPVEAQEHGPIDEEILDQLRHIIEEQPDLFPADTRLECLVREGSFEAELLRLAAQKSADLICIGRLRPEDQESLGDCSSTLVRKSPASILVVPEGAEPGYHRILVPIDFSEPAIEALEYGVDIAAATPGASLTLLHVYSLPSGYARTHMAYERLAVHVLDVAKNRWSEIEPQIDFKNVPWTIRYELCAYVAPTILNLASDIDASLIVMGSHGRTGPAAALLGHVADIVCTRTTRPFLCVKRKGQVVSLLQSILQLFELQ